MLTAATPIFPVNYPTAANLQQANLKKSKIKRKKDFKTRTGIPNYTLIEMDVLGKKPKTENDLTMHVDTMTSSVMELVKGLQAGNEVDRS